MEARLMCPSGDEGESYWIYKNRSSCKKIGETYRKKQVILSSFHAG